MSGLFNIVRAIFLWLVAFVISSAYEYYGLSILLLIILPIYYFIVFKDSKQRNRKAMEKLDDTLMKDEEIIHKGIDKRPFALFSRRSVFAVTNSRIINLKRGLIGGYQMRDYQWKDLVDAKISENVLPGICGSTLTFTFSQVPWIMVYPDLKTASETLA